MSIKQKEKPIEEQIEKTETIGEILANNSIDEVEKKLKELGISIRDENGDYLDAFDLFELLPVEWRKSSKD